MPTPNGPRNQPRFDINDDPDFAADLTAVSEYAAKQGNRKVGTSTERASLSGNDVYEGLEFWETNTKTGYRMIGGVWTVWEEFTGWANPTSQSSNYAADNGAGWVRVTRGQERYVRLRGQMTRRTGNIGAADGLFTLTTGNRPAYAKFFIQPVGSGAFARVQVTTDGLVSLAGIQSGVTATYVVLDNMVIDLN